MSPAPSASATAVDPAVPSAAAGPPRALAGHVALVAVQFCFGLFPVFAKFALAGLTPQAIAAWRIGVGSAVFLGLALALSGRRALPRVGDLALLTVCALLGVVGNQVLALEGFARSTAVNAGLIMTLIPVFTFALAALFRQERFHPQRALGIPLGVIGAAILTLQGGETPELSRQYLVGNLLMATNCLCYAGYLILSRRLLARYSPLTMIAWVYTLSLWAVPLLGYDEHLLPSGEADATQVWIGLALVLTFPTVLAYLLNTFALSRVPASVTAIYIYLQPLIAGMGGVLVLDERFRPAMVPAAACMFAAIFLVTRKPGPKVPKA